MATTVATVRSHTLLPSFDPLDTITADLTAGAFSAHCIARVDGHSNVSALLPFHPGHPSDPPSARSTAEQHSLSNGTSPPAPLPISPSYPITPIVTDGNVCGRSNGIHAPESPNSHTAPPLLPQCTTHIRPKSVSIVAPIDISHPRHIFSHSNPDSGDSCRTSSNPLPGSSDNAPAAPTPSTSQYPAAHTPVTDDRPFSCSSGPLNARPSDMHPVTHNPPSTHARHNKLHKPRPHHSPSLSAGPSVIRLLSRAFGPGKSPSRHSLPSNNLRMSDRSYRPTRSLSDGSTVTSLTCPSPSSWSSDMTDSRCTSSSSGSTSSYALTALTTPDSTSPVLSPWNSARANKLQKKRPTLAPSAYQHSTFRRAVTLGRSKSTPNGLGQHVPRNRIWSSVEEARHAAEEAFAPGETELSWNSSSAEASSSRRSILGPILEVRKKISSQAPSDVACTGPHSLSIAVHSSQLGGTTDLDDHEAPFNPYAECTSQAAGTRGMTDGRSNQRFPASSLQSDSQVDSSDDVNGSTSGFAVVSGYLDRSEDAMRRWTLAMADVPDEVLLHHLERLRKESAALARGRLPSRKSTMSSQIGHASEQLATQDRRSSFFFGGPREMGISHPPSRARFSVGHFAREDDQDDSDEEALSDEEDWTTARQVLFCCRELVQTERNYQSRLRQFASTELAPRYASLVTCYVPALLRVSEMMLAHLLDDPSAWGVSAAFIGCEEDLEAALTAWSGVVGEFFVEDANFRPTKKLTKKFLDETLYLGHDTASSKGRVFRTCSQVALGTSTRRSRRFSATMSDIGHGHTSSDVGHGTGMFTAALGTGLALGLSPGLQSPSLEGSPANYPKPRIAPGLARVSTASSGLGLSRAMNAWKRMSMPSSLSHIPSLATSAPSTVVLNGMHVQGPHRGSSSAHSHTSSNKLSQQDTKLSARDLAIQPIQRVMRYVLQYRDLLERTPTTSPSRALAERAYDSALRIAERCNRAQAHADFFRQSTDGTKNVRPLTTA